jgi:hypothetical protein
MKLLLLILIIFLVTLITSKKYIEKYDNYEPQILYFIPKKIETQKKFINSNYQGNKDSLKNSKYFKYLKYDDNFNLHNKIVILDFSCGYGMSLKPCMKELNKILPHLNKTKKNILMFHDLHAHKSFNNDNIIDIVKFIKKYNFKVICNGWCSVSKNHDIFIKNNIKFLNLPHHVNNDIFKKQKIKKKYDILILGEVNKEYYPFRYRLFELFKKNFKISIMNGSSPENLSGNINMSFLGLVTPSISNIFLQKYLEIPLCGTCPIGNLPENNKIAKNLYKNDFIEITPEMTDEQIINITKKALQNKKDLQKKADNITGRLDKYNCKFFSKNLKNLCEMI